MPATICERCIHFKPDPINPEAGMGQCQKGNGCWHPTAPHLCKDHDEGEPHATNNP